MNTAQADRMRLLWSPCCVHLSNLVVRHFLDNCPKSFREILGKINSLRCKTLWVEHLAKSGSPVRNFSGFVPTRWCSVCTCLESFRGLRPHIISFQTLDGDTLFSEKDFELIDGVISLFARFGEVNELLMSADKVDGLATVYEAINAIYMVLRQFSDEKWPFYEACQLAKREIELRFFRRESKFCCRLLFSGVLNVAHSSPQFLDGCLAEVLEIMANEVELYTGATAPSSPSEYDACDRYSGEKPLRDIINDSPCSEDHIVEVRDEISRFMQRRSHLPKGRFSLFWQSSNTFPHLRLLALHLRSIPTNTVRLESTFSTARRILAWHRMRLYLFIVTCLLLHAARSA